MPCDKHGTRGRSYEYNILDLLQYKHFYARNRPIDGDLIGRE
jgi:hypothetical protein